MARTAKTTAKKPKRKAPAPPDVVEAALDLFGERGYAGVGMADVAAAAGRPLGEVLAEYPSKGTIIAAWLGRIDVAMVGDAQAGAEDSMRDRLFDVVMRRFDLLAPRKALLAELSGLALRDPLGLGLVLAASLRRSIRWMLAAAGSEAEGLRGLAIRKGLAALYADVLRVWLKDETEDLARTMAHLDKRLRQAGDVLARLTFARSRDAPAST